MEKWSSIPVINGVTNDLGYSSLKPKPSADLGQDRLTLAGLDIPPYCLIGQWRPVFGSSWPISQERVTGTCICHGHCDSLGWSHNDKQISKTEAWVQTVLCHFLHLLPKASHRWWRNGCYLLLQEKLQRIMATFCSLTDEWEIEEMNWKEMGKTK